MIALSLRHFFPEHWDGVGDTYSIAQHVDDVIGFIEQLDSQTGRPDGSFAAAGTFRFGWRSGGLTCCESWSWPNPAASSTPRSIPPSRAGPRRWRRGSPHRPKKSRPAISMADWRISWTRWRLWNRLPASPKQLLRDNAMTLIGQVRDDRPPFSKSDAEAITTPTLFIGGGNTKGTLPQVLRALAAHVEGSKTAMIPGTTHPMFEQAPQKYCEIVLEFLGRTDRDVSCLER